MTDKIAVALVVGMTVPATCFPLLYLTFYRWYAQPIGRALMTKAIGLALLVDISVAYMVLGDDYPGREYVRLVVYSLILVGLWYQFIVFLRIKRDTRRIKREARK